MRFGMVAIACALMASQAGAVTYIAELKGTIYEQIDPGFNDPNISVGETITVSAKFDESRVYDDDFPGPDYNPFPVAHLGNLRTTGAEFFRVDSANLTWGGADRFGGYGYPWITFENGKITNLWLFTLAADSDATPGIDSVGPGDGLIYGGDHIDGNTYVSPGFRIRWDFAGSSVSAVPEPASWAMMIAGFGAVGATMRRRRGVAPVHA